MRSTASSGRHPRSCPPHRPTLHAIARLVDEATVHEPGHVLFHVADETPHDFALGLRPVDRDIHPFSALAGLTAPPDWTMFGIRATGTAHHLDGDRPSERITTTFLLGRDGREASLLRSGDDVHELHDRAIGTIPDVCRRVLGLPTDPPPASTALAFALVWLDRVLDQWGDPTKQARLQRSWAHIAVLHPAVRHAPDDDLLSLDDPARLVSVARAHGDSWPWCRLRAEPDALPLPDGHLPADVTAWMDDGFYARWALGAFPPPRVLARDLCALLDPDCATRIVHVLEELVD